MFVQCHIFSAAESSDDEKYAVAAQSYYDKAVIDSETLENDHIVKLGNPINL